MALYKHAIFYLIKQYFRRAPLLHSPLGLGLSRQPQPLAMGLRAFGGRLRIPDRGARRRQGRGTLAALALVPPCSQARTSAALIEACDFSIAMHRKGDVLFYRNRLDG